jgi:hypothetical protein
MSGNYISLREFARELGLSYNGNFMNKTKGWKSERVAKELQISCKIQENLIEERMKQVIDINEKVLDINTFLMQIIQRFAVNKDYCKFAFKNRRKTSVEFIETPYVRISEINKAANAMFKITKAIERSRLGMPKTA